MTVGYVIHPGAEASEEVDAELQAFVDVLEELYSKRHQQIADRGWDAELNIVEQIEILNDNMVIACQAVTQVISQLQTDKPDMDAVIRHKEVARDFFLLSAVELTKILEGITLTGE